MDQQLPDLDEGQLLRERLFEGDLLELPYPEGGIPGFLPEWYDGPLPALVYPPLAERGVKDGENIDLQISHVNIYYGALRALAETAETERAEELKRLVLGWNETAAAEVCQLGRMQVERDVETAILHYELAMELDPAMYEAVQDAGMCEYALAQAVPDDREERIETARSLFERAVELRPEAGLSWWSLARAHFDLGEGAEAEALLRRFLEEHPEGEQREMVQDALRHGFESASAEADAQDDARQTFAEAQALAFGDDPARAVELLQPLAEAYPDSGEVWFTMGAAYRRSGPAAEAERCLRRAARLAPAEPFVWWELARACMDTGGWRPAEEAIRKALELDPENAIYHADLSRILLGLGDREGARDAIDRAQELAPDDPEVVRAVGMLTGA
jgi:tetratricopeptide (TPR) repeat protein